MRMVSIFERHSFPTLSVEHVLKEGCGWNSESSKAPSHLNEPTSEVSSKSTVRAYHLKGLKRSLSRFVSQLSTSVAIAERIHLISF